ncbi:hypothetical protein BDW59DRAFT_158986 [Aspergillus cavernicola]|uniref:Mid2 domain-containing protein n=1 Tax=Aspergillus cavernicola TaxID=176166 RepID=A0ABR4IP42_9EURO
MVASMVTSVVLLLWTVAATLAEDYFFLVAPLEEAVLRTDDFTVVWSCNYDCEGPFTVQLSNPGASGSDNHPLITTVDAPDSSTTLPASFLPAMRPRETSVLDFAFYSMISGDWSGITIQGVSLIAPAPTTDTITQTQTVTATPPPRTITATAEHTPTPSATAEEEEEGEEEIRSGGLSTGAKAGIAVGVCAGVLLLAAGGFMLLRRRRKIHRVPGVLSARPVDVGGSLIVNAAVVAGTESHGQLLGDKDIVEPSAYIKSDPGQQVQKKLLGETIKEMEFLTTLPPAFA